MRELCCLCEPAFSFWWWS